MRSSLTGFIALALWTPLSTWSTPLSGASGLPSGQAETIRTVGQAVLQAKKSLTPDPETEEMRQSAKALRAAVDEAVLIVSPPDPTRSIVNSQAKGNVPNTCGCNETESTETRPQRSAFLVPIDHFDHTQTTRRSS